MHPRVARLLRRFFFFGTVLSCTVLVQADTDSEVDPSPESFTPAIPLLVESLPNAYQVSPTFYRGAQPEDEGFEELKTRGIKTVLSLRSFRGEGKKVRQAGMDYERLAVKPWHVEDKEIRRFLEIVTDEAKQPVFVHCKRGADRTGLFVAIYRTVVQGWDKQKAKDEMTKGPFGYASVWKGLKDELDELNVGYWQSEFGIVVAPVPAASDD